MKHQARTIVVGISGGTASGKSSLAQEIADNFPKQISVILHDDYYKDLSTLPESERETVNFESFDALETDRLLRDIAQLRAGKAVNVPTYDFRTHTRGSESRRVVPTTVTIIEGVMVLADSRIRNALDFGVFVELGADIRFIRRLQRDTTHRARSHESVISQYLSSVRPFDVDVVSRSKDYADVIVNTQDFSKLVGVIRMAVKEIG